VKTVLVTGAAGTVGNYVVGLAEALGYRVVASDKSATQVRVPVRGEVRTGDIRHPEVAASLVRGVDYVIHTAAQLAADAEPAELTRTNTDAVAELYRASSKASVSRFVHMSTAMLYATKTSGALDEEAPLGPRGPHGMSKHGAETFLRGQSERDGPAWTILRAAPIYGRRGRHFAASLLSIGPILRLGTPILPRPTGGPVGTMAHAEDVARALLFVLERADTRFEVFNVSDGDALALGDRIAETFDAYRLKSVRTGAFPGFVLERVGRLFTTGGAYQAADAAALSAWKLVTIRHGLKTALRPRLDREALTLLYDDLVVDASKLRALGFRPRFPSFSEGFREVLRWYQAEGWVPRYA
jgi:nucleoside-diphosphate-sugar epimerase